MSTICERGVFYIELAKSTETMATMVSLAQRKIGRKRKEPDLLKVKVPYVNHIATLTGGVGYDDLARFYKHHFTSETVSLRFHSIPILL